MKAITFHNLFEVKIAVGRMGDDGTVRKVKETYVVNAVSFADAENRVFLEIGDVNRIADVLTIVRAPYKEVFFLDNDDAEASWYKVKVAMIILDEQAGKERKSSVYYLVQGSSLANALANVDTVMRSSMIDYVSASGTETNVCDIFK